ncbi:MAG: carboxymuconolactone decarboxylase family protein [Rhodobacteraceae bacterium]|nr:carboxymuconolactone decarboxylase family protein [Paracoccaceae bacterium]
MFVKPKPTNEYPWYIRLFFAKQKRTYGKVLEPGMLWARAPSVFIGVALLYGAINRRRSPLSPELRSLVTVRVSQINHCEFCVDINAATLLKRGASEEKVAALSGWRAADVFDELECAALEFTEVMTITGKRVDQPLIDRLRGHLNDDGISELAGLIAFQNLSSKFNSALDMPAQGFCQMPGFEVSGATSLGSNHAG